MFALHALDYGTDQRSKFEVLDLLIKKKALVNKKDVGGNTVLMRVAFRQDLGRNTLQFLMDHGADKTLTNDEGQTAAMILQNEEKPALAHFVRNYQN